MRLVILIKINVVDMKYEPFHGHANGYRHVNSEIRFLLTIFFPFHHRRFSNGSHAVQSKRRKSSPQFAEKIKCRRIFPLPFSTSVDYLFHNKVVVVY